MRDDQYGPQPQANGPGSAPVNTPLKPLNHVLADLTGAQESELGYQRAQSVSRENDAREKGRGQRRNRTGGGWGPPDTTVVACLAVYIR